MIFSDLEIRISDLSELWGYHILSGFTDIPEILNGVKTHHEFYDGSGYPEGLEDGEIPLIGRILAVADAYDAMTSKRPYRKVKTKKEAIEELKSLSGIQFDRNVVKTFLKIIEENSSFKHLNNCLII